MDKYELQNAIDEVFVTVLVAEDVKDLFDLFCRVIRSPILLIMALANVGVFLRAF